MAHDRNNYTLSFDFSLDGMKNLATIAGKGITSAFKSGADKASLTLKTSITDAFNGAIKELSNILSFSRLSNPQTRELAFRYGFSSSEAYGYTQAMNNLGFESEEDLFYATEQEIELFRKSFDKYTSKYEKLYDSGFFDTLQAFQVEMAEFKQDMMLSIVDFFMEHKDLIVRSLKTIMGIADLLASTFDVLLGNSRAAESSDIISNYNRTSNNSSITQYNNFNNVDSSTSASIVDGISAEYRQIIKSFGGA